MGDTWAPSATASLVLPRPLPRDLRGRLEATADRFRAYLPAATCEGTWKPELTLTCSNGTAPGWMLRRIGSRIVISWNRKRPKGTFYATAGGVFAMPDGRVEDRSGQPIRLRRLGQRHRGDRRSLWRRIRRDRQQCERRARRDSRIPTRERAGTPASDAVPLPGP